MYFNFSGSKRQKSQFFESFFLSYYNLSLQEILFFGANLGANMNCEHEKRKNARAFEKNSILSQKNLMR
jgi:hypothetical protein